MATNESGSDMTGTDEHGAWPGLVADVGDGLLRAALVFGAERAGRAGALVAAAQAAALLGSRSAGVLEPESQLTAAVLGVALPGLLGPLPGVDPGAAEELMIRQFPFMVRGFVSETADLVGLAVAARLAAPLDAPDRPPPGQAVRAHRAARGGCSAVQALPLAVRALTGLGAPQGVRSRAVDLLAAGDELHRLMAEVRSAADPGARTLARAYGTLYAAAACLHLWSANLPLGDDRGADPLGGADLPSVTDPLRVTDSLPATDPDPLWARADWLAATLGELVDRLLAQLGQPLPPGAHGAQADRTARYGVQLLAAARAGAALTPFGAALSPPGAALPSFGESGRPVTDPAPAEEDRDV